MFQPELIEAMNAIARQKHMYPGEWASTVLTAAARNFLGDELSRANSQPESVQERRILRRIFRLLEALEDARQALDEPQRSNADYAPQDPQL